MQFGGAILYLAGMGIIQHSYPLTMVAIVIPSIFLAGVYFAPFRWVLSQRLITAIGAASYSFYLLHQYIGVTLIHFLSGTLHLEGKLSALVAIVITIAVASVARLIYVYWEHPINRYIVDRLCGKPSYLQQYAGRSAFSSIPVPPREVIRKVELSE
jgi:peptidoglycan/LPS O-acetylase OafA/YrhL